MNSCAYLFSSCIIVSIIYIEKDVIENLKIKNTDQRFFIFIFQFFFLIQTFLKFLKIESQIDSIKINFHDNPKKFNVTKAIENLENFVGI